jgi:hypothetical protein
MTLAEQTRLAIDAHLKDPAAATEVKGVLNMLPWTSALGLRIGNSTASKIGFYGLATPIVQPVGAAQTECSVTATTTAVITLVNGLRAALVALGLVKGAA